MSYRFNLPWKFYLSLLAVLIIVTYAWDQFDDDYLKFNIKIISLVFTLICVFSALQLRNGKAEPYKNVLNAIWNIETAFVFVYAISIIYAKILYGTEPAKSFTDWAENNPRFFILLTNLLGLVAIARAAFAFTDMFKTSIFKLHEKTSNSDGDIQTKEDAYIFNYHKNESLTPDEVQEKKRDDISGSV
ncbi:hypothetical protein [Cedecea sp. MMO-103]|uniref:hypothetical protein n=1 Tax=Cedecea sp. MMO-103 TaxID=3081238 RepID=UPI00301A8DA3